MDYWWAHFAIAMLTGCALGSFAALWWGERGRRLAAERREMYGTPEAPVAFSVPQPPSPETRAANLGISETALNRGADDLQRLAKDQGRSMSRKDALQQARQMMHPDTPVEMGGL